MKICIKKEITYEEDRKTPSGPGHVGSFFLLFLFTNRSFNVFLMESQQQQRVFRQFFSFTIRNTLEDRFIRGLKKEHSSNVARPLLSNKIQDSTSILPCPSTKEGNSTIYSGKCLFLQQLFLACNFFRIEQISFFEMIILLQDYVCKYTNHCSCI